MSSLRPRTRAALRWTAIAAGAAALVAAGRFLPFGLWLARFGGWISDFGPAAYPLYAAAYALVTVLMGPAWLMTIGAGLLFGLSGAVPVWAGATLGAAASFLIGRHFAREPVARYAARDARFSAIDRAIARKGWRIVLLLRLSPFVPFVFSNYFYGLTAIRFGPYVASSAVGMLPLILLYTAFGAAGREAAGPPDGALAAWKWALLGGGVAVTLGATAYVARLTRRAIAEAGSPGEPGTESRRTEGRP